MVVAQLRRHVLGSPRIASGTVVAKLTNMQSVARAFEVGQKHYDIGNDLYEAMLDSRMVYTCGYMKLAHRCLKPGGVALIHTIGFHSKQALIDPFYHRYVFPNAQLPSLAQLAEAAEDRFVVADVESHGALGRQFLLTVEGLLVVLRRRFPRPHHPALPACPQPSRCATAQLQDRVAVTTSRNVGPRAWTPPKAMSRFLSRFRSAR